MAFPQLTLFRPLYLLLLSASYIPITIFHLFSTAQPRKLTSWPAFQHAWFGQFWSYFGPLSAENAAGAVEPILRNAQGVVLDIGPGSGNWVYLFAGEKAERITKIYGVEPNAEHHAALRRAVQKAGLDGKYEILGVGVEDLGDCGIEPGSVDTIVTVQVLCSVPGPQRIIKDLYPYLRPGGRWLVYEHIRTHYTREFVSYWQSAINIIWPHFFGGCCITRPTDEWLLQAGDWDEVKLVPGEGEGKFDTIPHTKGMLVKRR